MVWVRRVCITTYSAKLRVLHRRTVPILIAIKWVESQCTFEDNRETQQRKTGVAGQRCECVGTSMIWGAAECGIVPAVQSHIGSSRPFHAVHIQTAYSIVPRPATDPL